MVNWFKRGTVYDRAELYDSSLPLDSYYDKYIACNSILAGDHCIDMPCNSLCLFLYMALLENSPLQIAKMVGFERRGT